MVGGAIGAVVLSSWAVVAAGHADDLYRINFVSGAWLALVRAASEGLFYPPLFDGTNFGGTRYMPFTVLLTTGVNEVVSDPLLAGKLVTYASCVVLAVLVLSILRREGVSLGVGLLLAAALAVSLPTVTLGVRGDVPPVVLQLGAVAIVARSTTTRAVLLAGGLVGLAALAKLNALWALAAIVVWLLARERRRLPPFLAAFVATAAVGLAGASLLSDGRFVDNIRELAFADGQGLGTTLRYATGIAGSPPWRLLTYLGAAGGVLVTLAVVRVALAAGRRAPTLYDVCLPFVVVTTLVTFLGAGAAENHLFDILVVSAVCAGLLVGCRGPLAVVDRRALEVAVVVLVGWTTAIGFQSTLRGEAVEVLAGRTDAYEVRNLEQLDARGEILSEDPTIPVMLGQDPIVQDPFMLRVIGKRHPEWVASLVERIDKHAFARILLTRRIDESTIGWYEGANLGRGVADAIRRSYRYVGEVEDAAVYEPRAQIGRARSESAPADPDRAGENDNP